MEIPTFLMERNQSLYENEVDINLTESGLEPLTLKELLRPSELDALETLRLGYNYTEGTPALRAAIATWYPGAGPENVLVTAGASEANFLAAWTLLAPERVLAMMLPNFMQLDGLARSLGATVRAFNLNRQDGWRPSRAEVKEAVGSDARLIALCNPNNPTGAVLSEEDMGLIIDAAARADGWLLSDEIYRGSELDGRPETPSFWGRYPKTIVTASTSKSLAHAGLRLGWMVAPADFIAEAQRRQDYTTIGTSPVSQFVAERILQPERREELLARGRALLDRNVEVIEAWVERWGNRLSFDRPMAGGMAFIAYDFPISSSKLSERLREEESVFVVAGDWFGMDGYLRIGTGGDPEELAEGLARIDRVLGTLA